MFEPEKIVQCEFYRVILEFLSLVFLVNPDEALMAKVISGDAFKQWPVDSENPKHAQALELLDGFCKSYKNNGLARVQQDYVCLFSGAENILAPPYESVFLSENNLIFEKQTLEVRIVYEQFGLKVPLRDEIPDDHLSYELQFIATMCDMIINAINKKDIKAIISLVNDCQRFLDDHLLKWISAFTARVAEHAKTDFYRGMSLMTLVTVKDFRQYLRYFS